MSEMWAKFKAKASALYMARPTVFFAMVIALVVVLMALYTIFT